MENSLGTELEELKKENEQLILQCKTRIQELQDKVKEEREERDRLEQKIEHLSTVQTHDDMKLQDGKVIDCNLAEPESLSQDDHTEMDEPPVENPIKRRTIHFGSRGRLLGELREEVKKLKKHNNVLAKQVARQENELLKTNTTLEEKHQEIEGLQGRLEKYREEEKRLLDEQIKRHEEDKLKAVTNVVDKLQLTEAQCAIYKADFESERNDRQRIHHELTTQLEQVQKELTEVNEKFHKSQQTIEELTESKTALEVDVKTKAKEIKELNAQVDISKLQGESLTKEKERKTELVTILQQSVKELQNDVFKKQNEINFLQAYLSTVNSRNWKICHKDVKILEELGRGGWGVVRKGNFMNIHVAIKQLHVAIVSDHNSELLDKEIKIMAQLHHCNLLQFMGAVYDHPSGNPLIITEIMDTSLRKAYEKNQLTPDQQPVILSIMRDVAVGLNYLHCLPDPIIHRDVSSANVLLRANGLPYKWIAKLSDFGSAKIARLAATKAAGAEPYSAPESFMVVTKPGPVPKQTTKMDVYSYGILLCETLTCTFPERDNFQVMLEQVRTTPNIGPTLCPVIVSCGDDDPVKRPTMSCIIDKLKNLPSV